MKKTIVFLLLVFSIFTFAQEKLDEVKIETRHRRMRVAFDGEVDVIDSASSALIRESIGGFRFRRDLPLLRGGSGRLCTVAPATLLHVRQLGDRRTLEAFTLTGNARDDALVGRHRFTQRFTGAPAPRLRFGNGDARRCLLLAEREVFVVSAPAERSAVATPRLSPLRPPGAVARAPPSKPAFRPFSCVPPDPVGMPLT